MDALTVARAARMDEIPSWLGWLNYWREVYARDMITLADFEAIAHDALLYGYEKQPAQSCYMDVSEILRLS